MTHWRVYTGPVLPFIRSNSKRQMTFLSAQHTLLFIILKKGDHAVDTDGVNMIVQKPNVNLHLLIARPPEICVNLVFKHIHAARSYTICRQFVPFIYCPL